MSLKLIRTYLEDRLQEIDPAFERVEKPFDTEEAGKNNFDRRFHIFYADISGSVANQNTTLDTINGTVVLYFDGGRDDQTKLDVALDVANAFRMRCMNPKLLKNEKFIKRFVANSVIASPLDSNDNQIKITLKFSISAMFGTNDDLNC